MKITIADFGPIASGSVELKPLSIFIGPNNAGKSYLSLAIYSLSRALAGRSSFARNRAFGQRIQSRLKLDRDQIKQASEVLREFRSPKNRRAKITDFQNLPRSIQDLFSMAFHSYSETLSNNFARELQRCFGTETSNLVLRHPERDASVFSMLIDDPDTGLSWGVKSQSDTITTERWQLDLAKKANALLPRIAWEILVDDPEPFLNYAVPELFREFYGHALPRTHYLPASRSGILLGHRTFASIVVERSSLAWIEPIEIPRLPGVITDLIQTLLLLDKDYRTPAPMVRVANFIESNVTGGTFGFTINKAEYPETFYENVAGRFSMHQVSSMVAEMASFVLYIKYVVRPGDLFIIEEPESHLDAANQGKVARAIAMLVNSGVHVIVTTHSDYLLSQVNNLMQLSLVTPRQRLARGYQPDEVLKSSDVGAYFFERHKEGTLVKTMDISAMDGVSTEQFSDVHRALYDEAVQLEHLVK